MESFVYYRISDGKHCGSLALDSLWAKAPANPTDAQLEKQGIVKVEIPPDVTGSIVLRYIDGKAIARFDPPPYWDELIAGLEKNPFYQRVNLLSEENLPISRCVSRISTDVFVLNREVGSFRWAFDRLLKALDKVNSPLTPKEKEGLQELLTQCLFPLDAIEPIPETPQKP